MDVIDGLEAFKTPAAGVVISIGNFDGLHIGHRLIVHTARRIADDLSVPQVVMTFEPHPTTVLRPEHTPGRLTTHAERLRLLEAGGADAVIVVRSTPAFFALGAQAFADLLWQHCRPRVVVEGPTFNYGRGRQGSVATLRAFGELRGFDVCVVQSVRAHTLPGSPEVNSSAVRTTLAEGRVADARVMLGRPHRVVGRVGHGFGRGAEMGVPTANLVDIPQVLPAQAVYAAGAQMEDGRILPAAVNVGDQPTFSTRQAAVEAHLLDYAGDLRGQRVGLHLLDRLRAQRDFGSRTELVAQLQRDIDTVRQLTGECAALKETVVLPL
ncbi:MAG: riboflavin biosynthesis protein RibF [Phycisphaerae bacterium]|nr:riboflavin biosynthesis protein RibF [Phycisphaerae bacterium]